MTSDVRLEYQNLALPEFEAAAKPRKGPLRWILSSAVLIAAFAVVWWKGETLAAWAENTWTKTEAIASTGGLGLMTYKVGPIDLRVTVIEMGTLESASSVNVLSAVEGQAAIISLVPEGERVEAGDVVVELESSYLRKRRTEQRIVVEKTRALYSQAVQENVVAASQAESDIESAQLAFELAELDLQKYLEGEYPLELRALETETALAEEELERARVRLAFSEDLRKDGYLQEGELEADQFRVKQAEFKVEIAKEKVRLLQNYTYPRTKRNLQSRVDEARRSLERAKSLAAAAVEQAKAKLAAQEATLSLEETTLSHIEDQIEKCQMRAPQAGVVVYPVPEDDDLVELFIKQGTIVRERQHVFSIPDTEVLQVSTSIHEAMVNQVKPGMQARVWVDVYPDLELRAEVHHVSPLPEPGDWRKTTVKFYETKITILDQVEGLRPGMSTKVEILIDQKNDVIAIPVTSVVQRGRIGFAYVVGWGQPKLRRLELGKSNFEHIEVVDGLQEGERIILSPDVLGIPSEVLREEAESKDDFEWDPQVLADDPAAEDAEPVVETEYEAVLLGPGNAIAEVEYEIKTQGDLTTVEFEVVVQGGEPLSSLDVTVDGVKIGSFALDDLGSGEVSWSTKHGTFPANFPDAVGQGSTVKVGTELEGTLSL